MSVRVVSDWYDCFTLLLAPKHDTNLRGVCISVEIQVAVEIKKEANMAEISKRCERVHGSK